MIYPPTPTAIVHRLQELRRGLKEHSWEDRAIAHAAVLELRWVLYGTPHDAPDDEHSSEL
jgi:hypothetical protein